MGCGSSSSFNEDGSVAPGKGNVKFNLTKSKIYYNFTDSSVESVSMKLKKVVAGEDAMKQKYTDDGVTSAGNNTFWVEVEGGSYMQAYTVDGIPTIYPGAVTADLPPKIWKAHQDDKEKFPKNIKKNIEKEKEHPYNAADGEGDKKVEEDLEKTKDMKSVHEMPDEMNKFKDSLVIMEDNIPMNLCNVASVTFDHGFGVFEKGEDGKFAAQLGLKDKALSAAALKTANPVTAQKIIGKKDEAMRMAITKAMDGACSAIGVERPKFLVTLDGALDDSEEGRPGATKKGEPSGEGKEPTQEEVDAKITERIEKQWASDKDKIAGWEEEDKDEDALKSKLVEKVDGLVEQAKFLDDAPSDGYVAGRYNGQLFEGKVNSGSGDSCSITFPATKSLNADTVTVNTKEKLKVWRGNEEKEEEFSGLCAIPEPLKLEELALGDLVRVHCKEPDDYYCNAVVQYIDNDEKKVYVLDHFQEEFAVEEGDIYYATNREALARRAWRLPTNFYEVEVWWVAAEDDVKKELNIWREGAKDETLQTVALEGKKAKAKPTKAVPEPTHEVFVGYAATVKLLPHRVYNFNFKVGEETFVDFGAKSASGEGYKRLTLKL